MLNKTQIRKLIIEPEVIIEKDSFANAWYRGLRHIKMNGRQINFGGVTQSREQLEKRTLTDKIISCKLRKKYGKNYCIKCSDSYTCATDK